MYVKLMLIDEWQERRCQVSQLKEPEWALVSRSIAALDGIRRVMVSLFEREESESCMIISGQWSGRVMVNATNGDSGYYSLTDDSQAAARRTLCVGGQDGEYDERRIVPVAWALTAAKTFYDSGKLDRTMSWDED